MKVYVGMMRLVHDGESELVVATTKERIEQELIKLAQNYADYLVDEEEKESLIGNTFDEWNDFGYNNEWFELMWTQCDVHSDGHILKHVMETI
jgi:hypothetical protein